MKASLSWIFMGLLAFVLVSCATPGEVHVVLLGGQSNMMGKGVYRELDRPLRKRIDLVSKRVRVSTNGGPAKPLSYWKKDRHVREFGPELFLGLTMAEQFPEREFLLVKTAVDGTSLHGAWNPDWVEEKAEAYEFGKKRRQMKLYQEHLESINANLKNLRQGGDRYHLMGIAWMQGESDTRADVTARNYEANLKNLIRAYRDDLEEPTLPFVFGQVNNLHRRKVGCPDGLTVVRKAMLKVTREVPRTAMIPTTLNPEWPDFPKLDDDVHYDTEGQKRLGASFAAALMKFD